jgi:hypothetical protein
MTWSVTIEKGRGSERTGVRSVRTLVVVSPESLETAGGVQKTQVLPFRISIHPEAYTCIPCHIHRSGRQMVYRSSVEAIPRPSALVESVAR